MEILPAIDLMGGLVVRLIQGDSATAKSYGTPVQIALQWKDEGAEALHIVDLDATMNKGNNRLLIERIVKEVNLPIQVGGGLRSRKVIEDMLNIGVQRVILGTIAFEDSSILISLLHKYRRDNFMVALDYLHDRIMIRGWTTPSQYTLKEAMTHFLNLGIDQFLLTSISRDGLLVGADYNVLKSVTDNSDINIYAAGGIKTLEEIDLLKKLGVRGVIIGKALYENRFTLQDVLRIAQE